MTKTSPNLMNPLDLNALRIQPDTEMVPTERIYTSVPIRKPKNTEFFRISPDPGHRFPCLIYQDRDDRDAIFIVPPSVIATAGVEIPAKRVELRLAVTRGGAPFLWGVPLPDPNGRSISWHTSAAEAAHLAQTRWVRMAADMSVGLYNVVVASGAIPDPDWSSLPAFDELLQTAIKGRIVDAPDHLILQRLRGEV
jgi:hypothetical protein